MLVVIMPIKKNPRAERTAPNWLRIICSAMVLAFCCSAPVHAATPTRDAASLLQTESQRYKAMQEHDAATLKDVLADELVYVHSSGVKQTKQEHVADMPILPGSNRSRVRHHIGAHTISLAQAQVVAFIAQGALAVEIVSHHHLLPVSEPCSHVAQLLLQTTSRSGRVCSLRCALSP